MAHDIVWLKPERVLSVNYKGHQTAETIRACLDDIVVELDSVKEPVIVLINWLEVTGTDLKALFSQQGHRAYSHPMAARGVLVGMPSQSKFENEVSAVKTRKAKNTQYYDTMAEAMDYLKYMLEDTRETPPVEQADEE